MDERTKLTEATLARSINVVCLALEHALETGKTLAPDQLDAYLIEMVFHVAFFGGWLDFDPFAPIEAGETVVMIGPYPVSERIYDEFLSLFWKEMKEQDFADWMEEGDSDPDPLKFWAGTKRDPQARHVQIASPSPESQLDESNPAQLLLKGKKDLGVSSWDQFALMASKHLRELEAQQLEEGILVARPGGDVTRDNIFRLLRGQNVRPTKVKAITMLLRLDWKLLLWPTEDRRRGRLPRK